MMDNSLRDWRWRTVATVVLVSGALHAAADSSVAPGEGFVDRWLAASDAAKESQPHWITPLVTVTPRLEQEYRYDQSWQSRPKSVDLTNYGGNKGLEVIPTPNSEIIIGVPAYQSRSTPKGTVTGWTDETLLLKYRVVSDNEEHGNQIVTGFLGVSLSTGGGAFTSHDTIITPTLAAGKGWGSRENGYDIQSTVGIAIPTADRRTLGMPISWNTALQAHVLPRFWPEVEASYTHYKDGPNDGKNQLALTAGLIAGRFEVTRRVRLIVGGGYQKVVSSFKVFEHTWLLTARATF